jgi:hypothetical protein
LILLKATASIPHEGGKRFPVDSLEYRMLSSWIASGMPRDPENSPTPVALEVSPAERVVLDPAERVQLKVAARFSDGSTKDVTRLAAFECSTTQVTISPDGEIQHDQFGESTVLVRYLHLRKAVSLAFVKPHADLAWPSLAPTNFVDELVFKKLHDLHLTPSTLCDDGNFLRRAYLDLLGILPDLGATKAFLADQRADKRTRLIDSLLERPEFADFWALKWSDVLHNEEKSLDRKGVEVFHEWIRQALLEKKPLNEFARELIAARGSSYANPASSFYRALRDPAARGEAAAQVFLGVRLQCARCHNHPFDQWTQLDYHAWTAFFARVQYRIVENNRRDRLDKHEFDGEQIVWQDRSSEWQDPRTGADLAPKFLGDNTTLGKDEDRLLALADWIAKPDNPFFARAQANRVWYHLLGRGLVEPNDDFRASNPPANAPLLDALARDLAAHGFDLRHLIRTIMTSTTYQLSAVPNVTNREDESNFSHAMVRALPAEVLLDALGQASGARVRFRGLPEGMRATQLSGVGQRNDKQRPGAAEQFLQRFGKPERLLSCDCERSDDVTLSQAFQLITGETINRAASLAGKRLSDLLHDGKSAGDLIDDCYLAALCRHPTSQERAATDAVLGGTKDEREAFEDLLAALLSSKEFLLRH